MKIDPQEGPQIHQKSMKIQPWTPRCPLWCPCGPMHHQQGDPRTKIKPPRSQNGASRSPKLQFRIKQIIHVTNNLSAVTCSKGGRRQGRSLKISAATGFSLPLGVWNFLQIPITGYLKGIPPPILRTTAAGPPAPQQLLKWTWKSDWKNICKNAAKSATSGPKVPQAFPKRPPNWPQNPLKVVFA